jgi:NAD(P)H-dependent flavin oxidoreductase YrpB (nitropropane dioxygenase family)
MLQTPLCQQLGVDYPIWNAGMGGGSAGPELAAAVSEAGGFGVLGMGAVPPPLIGGAIAATRELTEKPFGVNLLLPLLEPGQIEACLEARISALILFWGDVTPYVKPAQDAGVQIVHSVGSVDEAEAAADAGVDAVLVQGVEAGGHVKGTSALSVVLPAVVAAVDPLPVIAAGGIANGRGLAAALMLGAQAVSLGTRFLCSDEAGVLPAYKERIRRATAEDTVHTKLFDVGWPDAAHRVLRNAAFDQWEAAGRPPSGQRPGEGAIVGTVSMGGQSVDIPRYTVLPPISSFEGDIEQIALYAGQSCALIEDILPAAGIMADLVREAEAALAR